LKVKIEFTNQREFELYLDTQLKKSVDKTDKVLRATAEKIASVASEKEAPVGKYPSHWNRKAGFLRRNIKAVGKFMEYEVQSNANYSYWQEYGTRNHPANPFFKRSIEQGMDYMDEQMKKF